MEPDQPNRPSVDDPRHRTPDSIRHSEVEDLWSKYKLLLIGVPLLVVLVVFGWMWMEIQRSEETTAARQALSTAETQEDLRAVAEEYSKNLIGAEALLLLSQKQHEEGDLTAASETLTRFTNDYPKHPLLPGALFALAGINGQLGDNVRALDLYRRVRNDHPDSYVAGLATESAARLLAESGKTAEAVTLMEERLKEMPTDQARQAMEYQIAMLQRVKEPLSEIPDPEPAPAVNDGPLSPLIPGTEGLPGFDSSSMEFSPMGEEGFQSGAGLNLNPDEATGEDDILAAPVEQPAEVAGEDAPAETETDANADSAPEETVPAEDSN